MNPLVSERRLLRILIPLVIAAATLHSRAGDSERRDAPDSEDDALREVHGEFRDGSVYQGTVDGQRLHGHGTLTQPDGARYEGDWYRNRRQGYGRQAFPGNQEGYAGEWHRNRMHGRGAYQYRPGERYQGEWKNGRRHGEGRYTYPNGDMLEGIWEKDRLVQGTGRYTFQDGAVYEGEWASDRMHGEGVYTFPDGRILQGRWHNNRLVDAQEHQDQ